MNTIEALLIAVDESAMITKWAHQLGGIVQGQLASEKVRDESARVVIIKLPLSTESDELALSDTEAWLNKHAGLLEACDAWLKLEFQVVLSPGCGSRLLVIPATIVAICGELGIDIGMQAIRELTPAELDSLRRH